MKRLLSVVLVTSLTVCSLFSTGFATLLDKRCGISIMSPRITGGYNAGLMYQPWMVYLHSSKNEFICGGSLIHPWFILTAGHCFGIKYNNIRIFARLGEYNSKTPIDCNYNECAPMAREYLVTNRIRHPNYNNPRYYDIALGRLSRQVIYTDSIRPICVVLGGHRWESYVKSRKYFVVSGWGTTPFANVSSILQTATLKHVDRYRCHYNHGYNVDRTHICAGDPYHYVGRGDSGSPLGLMINDSDSMKFVQFGIVSHHRMPYNGVSVFTNVLPYADWIRRVVHSYN